MSTPRLEAKVSEYSWLTVSSRGVGQSTTLPTVIKTFEDFARCDVYTGSIDPTYWPMNRALAQKPHGWAARFAVAMLCYYHMDVAEKAAEYEGSKFWDHLESIFPTAPRATERRHFRGSNGTSALASMRKFSPEPANFFNLFPNEYLGVKSVCERNLVQFGPYFQLKICDYMDRCLDIPVRSFAGLERNLPGFPLKAAKMLYPQIDEITAFLTVLERVTQLNLLAPPKFDRPMGPAEVETLLCDYKRAKSGVSWMGQDVVDKYNELPKGSWIRANMPQIIRPDTFKLELV